MRSIKKNKKQSKRYLRKTRSRKQLKKSKRKSCRNKSKYTLRGGDEERDFIRDGIIHGKLSDFKLDYQSTWKRLRFGNIWDLEEAQKKSFKRSITNIEREFKERLKDELYKVVMEHDKTSRILGNNELIKLVIQKAMDLLLKKKIEIQISNWKVVLAYSLITFPLQKTLHMIAPSFEIQGERVFFEGFGEKGLTGLVFPKIKKCSGNKFGPYGLVNTSDKQGDDNFCLTSHPSISSLKETFKKYIDVVLALDETKKERKSLTLQRFKNVGNKVIEEIHNNRLKSLTARAFMSSSPTILKEIEKAEHLRNNLQESIIGSLEYMRENDVFKVVLLDIEDEGIQSEIKKMIPFLFEADDLDESKKIFEEKAKLNPITNCVFNNEILEESELTKYMSTSSTKYYKVNNDGYCYETDENGEIL